MISLLLLFSFIAKMNVVDVQNLSQPPPSPFFVFIVSDLGVVMGVRSGDMKSPSSHADAPTLTSLLRMSEGCQRFHVGGKVMKF